MNNNFEFVNDLKLDWLNISEAAKILGCGEWVLREWDECGLLKAEKTKGGHRRYRRSIIEDFTINQKHRKPHLNIVPTNKESLFNGDYRPENGYVWFVSESAWPYGSGGHYWSMDNSGYDKEICNLLQSRDAGIAFSIVCKIDNPKRFPNLILDDWNRNVETRINGTVIEHQNGVHPISQDTGIMYYICPKELVVGIFRAGIRVYGNSDIFVEGIPYVVVKDEALRIDNSKDKITKTQWSGDIWQAACHAIYSWAWASGHKKLSDEYNDMYFKIAFWKSIESLCVEMGKVYHLCRYIVREFAIDDNARNKFIAFEKIYCRGEPAKGSSQVVFENCGLKVLRDWFVCHAVAEIKAINGHLPNIMLMWDTCERTVDAFIEFCKAMEAGNISGWVGQNYWEALKSDDCVDSIAFKVQEADKFWRLFNQILTEHQCIANIRITDFKNRQIEILDQKSQN